MAKNSVGDAKQEVATNCQLEDVEICYVGVQEAYTVDEDGTWGDHKETYTMEAEPSYYYCENCQEDWRITTAQDREQAFKLVKEHLNA